MSNNGRSPVQPIAFSEADLARLVSELYGLQVKLVLEYASYIDRTYLLEDAFPSTLAEVPRALNPASEKRRNYILKVNATLNKEDLKRTSVQNNVILFAREAGFPVPAPIRTKGGNLHELMSFQNLDKRATDTNLVRLFEYLPGTTLQNVKLTKPLCRQIGHFSGWLDKIYQTYTGYDESVKTVLKNRWHLSELPSLKNKLDIIKDNKRHSLVKSIISVFEEDVLKHERNFSKGFIHGDMNECNILVSQRKETEYTGINNDLGAHHVTQSQPQNNWSQSSEDPYHVVGIIDFDDFDYSCHLFEIAIGMCYVMMNTSGLPILEAAGCVLCDYLKHVKLSDFELDRLKTCVCARLALSVVLGLLAQNDNPNDTYKLLHLNRQWAPMEQIWAMSDKEFLQELFKEKKVT